MTDIKRGQCILFSVVFTLLPQPLLLAVLYLLLTYTISWVRTCLSIWLARFRGSQKKTYWASWYMIPLWWTPSIGERNERWWDKPWGNLKRHRESRCRYWMPDIAPHQSHISLGTDSACLRKARNFCTFIDDWWKSEPYYSVLYPLKSGSLQAVWHSCSYRKIKLREGNAKCHHLKKIGL